MLTPKQITQIFLILAKHSPHPTTELLYCNNYTLLIAVVLSAQAKDLQVNIATKELFHLVQTPENMIQLGEQKLISYIKNIGLYKNKAHNIILLSQQLIDNFHSQVPSSFDALISLHGVGRKTANVVLNVAFNMATIPVDTHVFRVAKRIGLSTGITPFAVEQDLLQYVPPIYRKEAHHLLILLGRYICKAKKFDCILCPLSHVCEKNIY